MVRLRKRVEISRSEVAKIQARNSRIGVNRWQGGYGRTSEGSRSEERSEWNEEKRKNLEENWGAKALLH